MDKIKSSVRSWLEIKDGNPKRIIIRQSEDLQSYFIKNKIWYRGDSNELSQLYKQLDGKETTFWGSVPTSGLDIKKSHSGLPSLIVSVIANIVIDNYNGIECDDNYIKEVERLALEKYHLTIKDKISNINDNLKLINAFMSVIE